MSSSVTTFSGRRCTKVRRNATSPAGSGTGATLTSVSTTSTAELASDLSTGNPQSTTLAGAANAGNGNAGTDDPPAATVAQSPQPTISASTPSTDPQTTPQSQPPKTTPNSQTTPTSTPTNSSPGPAPAVSTNNPPAPAAAPPPQLSPPTPPPDPTQPNPVPASPDPSSSDDPARDTAAPPAQAPTQSAAQNSAPVAPLPSPRTSALSSSQAMQQPHASQSAMTVEPVAIPLTASAVTSIESPLAVSLAPSRASTFASSIIPVTSTSGTALTGPPSATYDPAAGTHRSGTGSGSNKAAMAGGAVGGVFAGLLFFGLIFFFCYRRYRRRGLGFQERRIRLPLLGRNDGPRSSSDLVGKVTRVAAVLDIRKYIKRRMPSVYEGPAPNPALSQATTRTPSPLGSSSRRRSWSAPAPRFRERLQTVAAVLPITRKFSSKGFAVDRRSPSMEESPPQIPPMFQFQRQNGSVTSISRAVYSPEPDDDLNPFRDPDPTAPLRIVNGVPSRNGTPAATPMQDDRVIFNPNYQPPLMPIQPPLLHQRRESQPQDPFLDPTEAIGTAVTAPSPRRTTSGGSSHRRAASISSLHSNRSSVGPLPGIPSLQPTQRGLAHQPQYSNASSIYSSASDVEFVSAVDASPMPLNVYSPAGGLLQTPAPTQPLRTPQGMAYQPSPGMTAPPSALRASAFSVDPNTFGEPGPTRPNTFFNDMATPGANTRMSDPFDLEPEMLGFTPNDSRRSYGWNGRRKTGSVSNWPIGPSMRRVAE